MNPCDPRVLGEGLYRTDLFHRSPLFAVHPPGRDPDRPGLLVRCWEEALALHGRPTIDDIEPAWLGSLISGCPTADHAPYRRIRRLPRAHWVAVEAGGGFHAAPYDPFAGGTAALEADSLEVLIRGGLLSRLRRDLGDWEGPIGCEHSSGLDSNAILGALVHGLGIPPERLHTLSDPTWGEGPLLEEFRHFHGVLQEQVFPWGKSWKELGPEGNNAIRQTIALLGAPPQLQSGLTELLHLQARGCAVLFSGFGGDQGLSHAGGNVGTDLVATGRWRELIHWCGGSRAALRCGVGRALGLGSRRWAKARVQRHIAANWCHQRLLGQRLTSAGRNWLQRHLQEEYALEMDPFLPQASSMRQRLGAGWISVRVEEETRLAACFGLRKSFPLLEEPLIAMALDQDPLHHAARRGEGRQIARRAYAPYLPTLLHTTPAKARPYGEEESRRESEARRAVTADLAGFLRREAHPMLRRCWDLDTLLADAEGGTRTAEPDGIALWEASDALHILRNVSLWLAWLEGEPNRTITKPGGAKTPLVSRGDSHPPQMS
jgi:hypothetical protein